MIRVYIAGAFVEQEERAKPMMAACKQKGITITHNWTVPNFKPGGSDADLTHIQRRKFALEDLIGVTKADVLWLLAPEAKGSCGAWVELGFALALRDERGLETPSPVIIVSGSMNKRSIFTELADRLFDTDAEALKWLEDQKNEVENG